MNDFTKEELDQLAKWATSDLDLHPSELEINLFNKIQIMIDKYCEHQNDPRFNAMPCSGAPKLCTKCKGFIYE